MKKNVRRMILAAGLAVMLTLPALAEGRVATIDLRKVFDNYWKRQQAEAALKDHGTDLDKEYKGMMDDYNKLKEEYSKLLTAANDQSVTAEERDKRKNAAEAKLLEIRNSENTIKTFEGNARDQLDSQRKRMRDTILAEIRTAIDARAKSGGFAMVMDTSAESANGTPVLLYTNGDNDLTEAILTQLNAGAPAGVTTGSKDDKVK